MLLPFFWIATYLHHSSPQHRKPRSRYMAEKVHCLIYIRITPIMSLPGHQIVLVAPQPPTMRLLRGPLNQLQHMIARVFDAHRSLFHSQCPGTSIAHVGLAEARVDDKSVKLFLFLIHPLGQPVDSSLRWPISCIEDGRLSSRMHIGM